jgi:hypothetical protein
VGVPRGGDVVLVDAADQAGDGGCWAARGGGITEMMRDNEMYDIGESDDLGKSKILTVEKYERISRLRMALGTAKEILEVAVLLMFFGTALAIFAKLMF